MPIDVSSGIPDCITKGDSVSFTVNDSDFPVGDWPTAQIVFRFGETVKTFTAEVSDLDQLFELDGAATTTLNSGTNLACIIYTDADDNRRSTDWQEIEVLADPTVAPSSTFASRSLAKIEIAIESLASGTNTMVQFNGQSFTKRDLEKMFVIRDLLKAEVASEQSGANLGISRSTGIRTRFAIPA